MTTSKSRQRGHGDYGFLLWLIASIPYAIGIIAVLAVIALLYWAFR